MAKLQTPPGCLPRLSPPHYLDDPIPGKQFRHLFGSLKMGKWMKHISVNAIQWIYDINMYIYICIYWLIYDIWSILGNISIHIWCYLPKRSLKATKNIHKLSTIDYFFRFEEQLHIPKASGITSWKFGVPLEPEFLPMPLLKERGPCVPCWWTINRHAFLASRGVARLPDDSPTVNQNMNYYWLLYNDLMIWLT